MNKKLSLTLAALLILTIVAANYVTTELGMIGGVAAGTLFAGLAFLVRDFLQEVVGYRLVLVVIAVGAAVSFLVSSPDIATASATAFALSESVDLAVYTALRERGRIRAIVASNAVGAVVDSIVFLSISGFGLAFLPGQVAGKLAVTVPVVAFLYVRHRRLAAA
jgi:uncharacterized PurR-regulated membrane protein YhhQ (DUF165 family)